MLDIKTKETVKDIRVLDKAAVAGERMKQVFIRSKDTAENLMDDGQVSPSEYAEDKIRYAAEDLVDETGHVIKKETDKVVEKGREALREHRREKRLERQEKKVEDAVRRYEKSSGEAASETVRETGRTVIAKERTIKTVEQAENTIKQTARSKGKATVKTAESSVKAAQRSIKTAGMTSRTTVKTAEATAKASKKAAEATAKAAQKAAVAAKQAAVAAYKAAVVVAKAVVSAVKAIIAAAKELVSAIAAGGWIAVIIIVVISLIGLIVGSVFGIFFSSEDTGSEMTMQQVVREINEDYQNRIETIKAENAYDDFEMSGSRAVWPQVLSVYAVKTATDPEDSIEVATMNDRKKQLLTDIFWEMNDISYRTETETETQIIETDDGNGNILEEEVVVTHTTLFIAVSHKNAEDMASQYSFNEDQKEQLDELLLADNSMWMAVLYGIYGSDDMIVQVALTQLGNIGGEPYWSWYGFGSRVEWCACFVSWCADQCGYIDNGVIPKYAGCVNGVNWFKDRGQWADNSIEPTPGMIIFFDWDSPDGESGPQDGESDHTGIVEKVENGFVYTVEGNSGDSCRENRYPVGYYEILGYGVPAY